MKLSPMMNPKIILGPQIQAKSKIEKLNKIIVATALKVVAPPNLARMKSLKA